MNSKKNQAQDKITTFFNDPANVTRALQLGIKDAIQQHKRAGNPICGWKNGKVVWISAEEIPSDK